ncbi:hypothetical protein [Clostridium chrysemydis]|uniref:hypothetical protein n=1 Tax=Clostridium chrysemydis TaxID=2665504 RepID=UPI003F3C16A6
MNTYKVKQEDLIGQLKGFPIEVAQAMVDEQVKQGDKADVSVFQNDKEANHNDGGFYWHKSKEGEEFWCDIIVYECFNTFFSKYPKQEQPAQQLELKYCNLYHNNATMKFKTGEHAYSDSDTAYENRKEDVVDGYRYFTTIECSIKE